MSDTQPDNIPRFPEDALPFPAVVRMVDFNTVATLQHAIVAASKEDIVQELERAVRMTASFNHWLSIGYAAHPAAMLSLAHWSGSGSTRYMCTRWCHNHDIGAELDRRI